MDRDKALTIVKEQLGEGPRYKHTLRVLNTALDLSKIYGAHQHKVEIAAIFHDYAKHFTIDELKKQLLRSDGDRRLLDYHPELWHGPVAATVIQEKYHINDHDIVNAIRYHTTGRAHMSLLEKIIFLADYIEPGRSFPGVDDTRELAKNDLDLAILQALSNTIQFLAKKQTQIFPDTVDAYNDFVKVRKL